MHNPDKPITWIPQRRRRAAARAAVRAAARHQRPLRPLPMAETGVWGTVRSEAEGRPLRSVGQYGAYTIEIGDATNAQWPRGLRRTTSTTTAQFKFLGHSLADARD